MVPLFKSVGYQLIYHTFTEKCELSNSNLELRPSAQNVTRIFLRGAKTRIAIRVFIGYSNLCICSVLPGGLVIASQY